MRCKFLVVSLTLFFMGMAWGSAQEAPQEVPVKHYAIRTNDILDILMPVNLDLEMLRKIPFPEGQFEIFANEIFIKKTIEVDPYGYINLPLVGSILVQGKTPAAVSDELSLALKNFIQDFRCEVLVQRASPLYFYIFGEVLNPARYEMEKEITAFEAIAISGGFTRIADKKTVKVIRPGTESYEIYTINLHEAIRRNQLGENILIKNKDIIIVQESFF